MAASAAVVATVLATVADSSVLVNNNTSLVASDAANGAETLSLIFLSSFSPKKKAMEGNEV